MEDPFWTHDTYLFDGTFRYYRDKKQLVRGKLHISGERYDFEDFGHSLERGLLRMSKGKRIYMLMHPYVIEPKLMMSVALYPKAKQYADSQPAIGKTIGTRVEGFRDVQVGNAQAWYYPEDGVIVLWECFLDRSFRDAPLREDKNMRLLWMGFERWLTNRYPEAGHIVTPWADPMWQTQEYQAFLEARGYKKAEHSGLFVKTLV